MSSNAELMKVAYETMPGASLGTFRLPEGSEFVVERGQGSRVYDVEDRAYLDYVLGSGAMVLGHAHPDVVAAVRQQIERGSTFYALNEHAIRLATKILSACPWAEMLKFCGSGGDATFYALRLARAATRRDKILKFQAVFHGPHDYVLMSVWPRHAVAFPTALPDSAGIPSEIQREVLIAPFNDLAATARILEENHEQVAAVIVEPINTEQMREPVQGFLEGLRALTQEWGIVLIYDEVVTGFRIAHGGAAEVFGVIPDLACYGKAVGGGLPLAAVAGKRELMELANPWRRYTTPDYTFFMGTLNGNALSAAAGCATLDVLEAPGTYERLRAVGERFRIGLRDIVNRLAIRAEVRGYGPLANIFFSDDPFAARTSTWPYDLMKELLTRGVLANIPVKMYFSLAHSNDDIDLTLEAFEDAMQAVDLPRC